MKSSFISTAAAIAKKQLGQRKLRNNPIIHHPVHQVEDNRPKMNGQQVDIEQVIWSRPTNKNVPIDPV